MKVRWMVKYGEQVRYFDDADYARDCYLFFLARGDKPVSAKQVLCVA